MKLLGNIVWFILGGFISFLSWGAIGILWSVTIVGIPIGMQCFKFATMSAAPFGKDIRFGESGFSLLLNVVWLVLGGFVMVVEEVTMGIVFCLTIVGIPFGLQHFKHAKLALLPFGATIYRTGKPKLSTMK
ncbi:YccF domain-containing protein [Lacticigenium naphthae]|uniref:YccF domain-containing protein n=1 Tax=Lacticigenium naphthae TaxID=515351 RepID=UPI0004241BBC|nr:YccF domain-containing protein [Lacticigenium naphthae]